MKKTELAGMLVYSAAGLLVGAVVGGTLMMKHAAQKDSSDTAAVPAAMYVDPMETAPQTAYPQTTVTFTDTTTTTTVTTTTTTEPPPPPLNEGDVYAALLPAKELLSQKYYYADTDTYEDYSEFFGRRLPFTTESVQFNYSGVITVGIDLSAAEFAVDNYWKQITVTLPAPAVLSNELDEDSITYTSLQTPAFGRSGFADYRHVISGLKEQQSEKVLRDAAFLADVTAHTEDILRGFLSQNSKTADFTVIFGEAPEPDGVTFTFLPEGGEAEPDQGDIAETAPAEYPAEETQPTEPAPIETAPAPIETEPYYEEEPYESEQSQNGWDWDGNPLSVFF